MARTAMLRTFSLVLALLTSVLVLGGTTGTAHAADGYRYWNYFHLENAAWAFSQTGAGDYTPEDGAVEGYRYGTSTTADGLAPRADLGAVTFDKVCAEADSTPTEKRVAVVIDYGTAADADGATPPAPRAACAVVDADANGQQVLEDVADVRFSKLVCALDGYPAAGCGEPVKGAEPADEQPVAFELPAAKTSTDATDAANADDDSNVLWPAVGAAILAGLIGAGAVTLNRRKKNA